MTNAFEYDGLVVPARTIPVPTTISPEAQASLAASAQIPARAEPEPNDLSGWKSYLEVTNAGLTELSQRFTHEHPGSVAEHTLAACTLYEVTPSTFLEQHSDKVLLYIHGGGFTSGWGIAAANMAHTLAGTTGLQTFSVDYRMPPDHPFPAGLDDAVDAYRYLLERYQPAKIAVAGGSAGAGLAASLMHKVKDLGLPLPAVCALASPEADLTESGDTFETNEYIDVVLKHRLTRSILLYANGHDLTDPYLSPLFGDFSNGFPPTILTAGTRDLFLSNAVRFHRQLRKAGVETELHVWEAMPHGGFFGAPEDRESYEEQGRFIRHHLNIL